jgi:Spy/CpxP family protein refolding chaperone
MGPGGPGRGMGEPNPNDRIERPRRDREQRLGLQGRWWDDQHTASSIHLRPEQQQRMDKIFETNKPALAAALTRLQKQESGLNAMSRKDLQDEDKVYAAIDGVANARAELARQNTRLLLMIRHELDPQQTAALDKQIASAR